VGETVHSLRWIIVLLGFASISWAATITCTITDQSGAVISNSCGDMFTYNLDVAASGSPQSWIVYASGQASLNVGRPYQGSISVSDYKTFSVPMVVLGGTGSGYLWYHATGYLASHATGGFPPQYIFASGSAPCYAVNGLDTESSRECYIPFTYGVPLTLSGDASVDGTLFGGTAFDSGFFMERGMLMGIVTDIGSHQLIPQDVIIEVLPEPTMLPPLGMAAFFLACRRLSCFRNQRTDRRR